MKRIDLTGQKFTRLTAIAISHFDRRQKKLYWECRCDCGVTTLVQTNSLTSGNTKSCGCWDREVSRERIMTMPAMRQFHHGHAVGQAKSITYRSWQSMKARCHNAAIPRWSDYGGRGIAVCERWKSFENFLADMGERPSEEYSIDRIDNDGNYEKANCRWATRSQQQRNKRIRAQEVQIGN